MAVSPCSTTTDVTQRELVEHGTVSFPIGCYADNLYTDMVPWHWHEEFEYAIAIPGSSTFLVENVPVVLRPGDAIFINAQVLHAVEAASAPGAGLHSAVFHPRLISGNRDSVFWEELVQPFLRDSALRYLVLVPEIPWQQQVLTHFHSAWDAVAQECEDYENLVRYHLSAALRLIVRSSPVVCQSLSAQERLDSARVRAMLEYIQKNFAYDITMREISQQINASNTVCLRCFHQFLGTTPIQYLKHYRLEQAAQMLKTTSKTAQEIALDCGFNDISYFTRSFREKMGATPRAYRKKNGIT